MMIGITACLYSPERSSVIDHRKAQSPVQIQLHGETIRFDSQNSFRAEVHSRFAGEARFTVTAQDSAVRCSGDTPWQGLLHADANKTFLFQCYIPAGSRGYLQAQIVATAGQSQYVAHSRQVLQPVKAKALTTRGGEVKTDHGRRIREFKLK